MNALHRIATAGVAAFLLTGCSILGGPKEAPTIYARRPRAAPILHGPRVAWQLSTARPGAAQMLDTAASWSPRAR